MNLAPVVLFVYNRPWHTGQTLQALAANTLANQSDLIIYADGPKKDASPEMLKNIKQTRDIAKSKNWCKTVTVIESETNKGLANSIIAGVTAVVNKYGKVIVVEDDIFTTPAFLTYMNDGLNKFQHEKEIGSVCAFWDRNIQHKKMPDYFILNGGDCWGWGTWQNRWDKFIPDPDFIKKELLKTNRLSLFDYGGMTSMLDSQIEGTIDSWHIRWQGSLILNNLISIFPKKSFIKNIGLDGSGTHGDFAPINGSDDFISLNGYQIGLDKYPIDLLNKQHPENEKIIRKLFLDSYHKPQSISQKIKRKLISLKNFILKSK